MLATAYGFRLRATRLKNEMAAMLAAEAGYEKAIYWMGQQKDMLIALQQGIPGTNGSLSFSDSSCDYQIKLFSFIGSRPIYRIISNGHSGIFNRTVEVYVVQASSGWDMGMCRIAIGRTSSSPIYFGDGEIVDMPVRINDLMDSPDLRDIYINGEPRFLKSVTMGESKYDDDGAEKPGYQDSRSYDDLMFLFEDGIYFKQPDCKITDEEVMNSKLERFRNSTSEQFIFLPQAYASASAGLTPQPAVQLEFFVEDDIGKVRITNNCTVMGFQQNYDSKTWDFKIKPGTDAEEFERYDIYAYHLMLKDSERPIIPLEESYVTQSFGTVESEPGGQIFVNGNVIIGGDLPNHDGDNVVKGRFTVAATGNIWIGDSIVVDGPHDANGKPLLDNPNVLGLISKGVIKIVDPGMTDDNVGSVGFTPVEGEDFEYVPIGRADNPSAQKGDPNYHKRHLPNPTVVEASLTVGGGGWGVENIKRYYYGGRKEKPGSGIQNDLILHGTITEGMRGVVGSIDEDGYIKHYYLDERLLEGILPGDIWLQGKYIPTAAGWHDYRH